MSAVVQPVTHAAGDQRTPLQGVNLFLANRPLRDAPAAMAPQCSARFATRGRPLPPMSSDWRPRATTWLHSLSRAMPTET